jgi:hypothetical protein
LVHGCRNSRPPSRLGNGRSHPIYDAISRRAGAASRRHGIPRPITSAGPEPQRLPAGWPNCSIPVSWTNQAVSRHTETAGSHAACAPPIQLIHCLFFWTSLGRTRRGTKDEGQAGGLLLVSALTFWEPKQESRRVARKTNPPDGSFPVLSSHTHGFPTDDKRASVAEPYCHWRRLTSSMHRATRLPAQSRYLSYSF